MQNSENVKAIQLSVAVFSSRFGSGVVTSRKASDQGSKAAVTDSHGSLIVGLKSYSPQSSIWYTRAAKAASEFTHTYSFISLTTCTTS